jgi:hypothetical protein
MPVKRNCKETLQQVRERLVREQEQRLRTEQRVRELLEPDQLAVTEDELVCRNYVKSHTTVRWYKYSTHTRHRYTM